MSQNRHDLQLLSRSTTLSMSTLMIAVTHIFIIDNTQTFQYSKRIKMTKAANTDHEAGYNVSKRRRYQVQSQRTADVSDCR